MLGDFDEFNDSIIDSSIEWMPYFLFFVATILFMIVLLNLLIAIIGDTYERVLSTYVSIFNYERTKLLFVID